jgi:hypothetical protein
MSGPDLYAAETAASGLARCLDEAIRHSLRGDDRREAHDVNLAIGYLQEAAEAMGFRLMEPLPPGMALMKVSVGNTAGGLR